MFPRLQRFVIGNRTRISPIFRHHQTRLYEVGNKIERCSSCGCFMFNKYKYRLTAFLFRLPLNDEPIGIVRQ